MASDNGDEGNQGDQPWPQPPHSSQWGPSSEHSSDQGAEPADDEPEEATIARPVAHPPSDFGESGNAPTSQYSWAEQSTEEPSAQSGDAGAGEPADSGPLGTPSSDEDRTQTFSRSDLRAQPTPPPMPSFPPPPPGGSYQPQQPPPYPPQQSPTPPQQGYPPAAPYQQPEQPYQPYQPYQPEQQPYQPDPAAWGQQPYGQQPYQPEQSAWGQPYGQQPQAYPPSQGYQQQPYGAPPQQQQPYGQYGAYGQQPYSPYPPGPPKKRHLGLWIGGAVVAVIVILAVVAFVTKPGFLGFKKVLDHTAVEKTIEKGGYTNVRCNNGKNPKVKKGATFTCTADGGKKVTVTITSTSGNYAWSPAS